MTTTDDPSQTGARRPVRPAGAVPAGDGPALPAPSGWFCLALSRELARGAVLTRRFADEDVVLYRTRAGTVRATRPYCPHMGAHLGYGSTVEGESLVCPFHRFAFGPDGTCVSDPDGVPLRTRVNHFPVLERNGFLHIWNGRDGEPPAWELPAVPGPQVRPTAHWAVETDTHPQEVVENIADFRHLGTLHRLAVRQLSPPIADGPYLRTNLRSNAGRIPFFGQLSWEESTLMAGLGWNLTELELPHYGLAVHLWGLPTPIGPWRTVLRVAAACEVTDPRRVPGLNLPAVRAALTRAVARSTLRMTARIIRQDVPIWDHKRYEPRPRLAAGDHSVGVYRHWARQFYPPGPPTGHDPA
ncbi:aromatic ring-hydroxylating dioxygenase subunit alpha [Kitasatospora sp. NPDC015120]|uniref:aromatic ring-hydroxylating oxygenase subunit alpha n=1 Tax=Kitasatospora sp. NPDC015120 TaxID=3364023 RepID=UPI0036F487B3